MPVSAAEKKTGRIVLHARDCFQHASKTRRPKCFFLQNLAARIVCNTAKFSKCSLSHRWLSTIGHAYELEQGMGLYRPTDNQPLTDLAQNFIGTSIHDDKLCIKFYPSGSFQVFEL
ncbi:hypothetical protein AVEN_67392-1 [Araneus ventricosus]|uniref:Uncharacterized protein n=1 Tax=Araneus ventricosus TaxID=182803 RepID=A0A4Y2MYD0_ARAVE|nr:hypothetical protein AVEN_67392-1 [Araneus ventricosus]